MKSNFWAIFGFIMLLTMALSAMLVIANEFNLVAGSPGPYLNSDTHLNAYRIVLGALVGFALAIVNIMLTDKK